MGAELSCDVCKRTLSEEHDVVRERVGATPEHVCEACFKPDAHKDYVQRTVYAVVGEQNARRMRSDPSSAAAFSQAMEGFSDCIPCPCGAETVRREGVSACFACGRSLDAPIAGVGADPDTV